MSEQLNQNIITKDGLKELQAELKKLVEIDRPEVIEKIKEARAQGDLSENAEFDAAREEQGIIEDRIAEIERIIADSKIVDSSSSVAKVRVGSTVAIKYDDGDEEEFTIVGTLEADPFNNKISNVSPLGSALLNRAKGDVVEYAIEVKNKLAKHKVTIKAIKNN